MNATQQIFLVFFAIFWGTVANAWPKRKPFQWPLIKYGPVSRRLILSVTLLNAAPILYFSWVLLRLSGHRFSVISGILPAFAIFGFYRIWLALAGSAAGWFYYSEAKLPPEIKEIEPAFETWPQWTWFLNLLFGLIYVLVASVPVLF